MKAKNKIPYFPSKFPSFTEFRYIFFSGIGTLCPNGTTYGRKTASEHRRMARKKEKAERIKLLKILR